MQDDLSSSWSALMTDSLRDVAKEVQIANAQVDDADGPQAYQLALIHLAMTARHAIRKGLLDALLSSVSVTQRSEQTGQVIERGEHTSTITYKKEDGAELAAGDDDTTVVQTSKLSHDARWPNDASLTDEQYLFINEAFAEGAYAQKLGRGSELTIAFDEFMLPRGIQPRYAADIRARRLAGSVSVPVSEASGRNEQERSAKEKLSLAEAMGVDRLQGRHGGTDTETR
jgi:hypothetical protein